ncbi:ABC transporter ATP-binding protein [Pseudoalteromonas sp.]|uniref:ABC transporter ATP-binding protein n=1 Tax=Pseudoalteromonas sp. TaxID=53249 RepID=UPI003002D059
MSLIINNLVKRHQHVVAVNKLSFEVQAGEVFALLGPNGAGKSSLVKMLVGFSSPNSGSIELTDDGHTYTSIPAHLLGYLPEDRGLYPEKTLKQNLQFFAALHGVKDSEFTQRCAYWLGKFNLTERLNDPLKSLSKGNQQKIQLITAILHKPKWVILDEPFSGLDPINQELVVEFLAQLKQQGMTVILSAHQMAMVEKLADRVLLLNQGESVLYGKLSDVLKNAQNNVIHITFKNVITPQSICQLSETYCIEHMHAHQLAITVTEQQSLNQLLSQLLTIGEVCEFKNHTQSLHAIYLQAVAEHNAKQVQGITQ